MLVARSGVAGPAADVVLTWRALLVTGARWVRRGGRDRSCRGTKSKDDGAEGDPEMIHLSHLLLVDGQAPRNRRTPEVGRQTLRLTPMTSTACSLCGRCSVQNGG